ncbi:NADH-FMN oxidoreductase RutF, flavin reductase (DIM6/NTAB) family [Ruminococcaceae bacterium YRB3002]|nr:NADH-FMN oxidoreductase RutF, flavin reductase (DIM6/NTAB) family [Ruminococcaceae bacterium YRB3002]
MAKHDKTDIGISTLLNPVPAVMISTSNKNGENNICTVAWAGTVNSEPPMVSISLRSSRLTHDYVDETGEFVINLVNKSLAKPCDRCGVRSGRDEDKFRTCGLTPVKAKGLDYAVAIKESPVSLSCKVVSRQELGSHDMYIAEIVGITADSYLMDDNGRLCLDKAKLVAYNHGEYFLLGEKIGFFGYSLASEDIIRRRLG